MTFNGLPAVGTRITWWAVDLDHKPYAIQGTLEGELHQHGYRLSNGGWSLLSLEVDDTPSYRVVVRRKRERRKRWLVLDHVTHIEDGWT